MRRTFGTYPSHLPQVLHRAVSLPAWRQRAQVHPEEDAVAEVIGFVGRLGPVRESDEPLGFLSGCRDSPSAASLVLAAASWHEEVAVPVPSGVLVSEPAVPDRTTPGGSDWSCSSRRSAGPAASVKKLLCLASFAAPDNEDNRANSESFRIRRQRKMAVDNEGNE